MASEKKRIHSTVDFLFLSLLAAGGAALAVLAYSFGGVDFSVYYAAARVYLQGGNPYDYSRLIGEIVSASGTANNPYYYAPWFTWTMLPLALLPFETARILWALVNFVLWFWGLFNLSSLIQWHPPGWRRWGYYLFLTFVFAWACWGSEQVGVLVFFVFTLLLLAERRGQWLLMGVWMAYLSFKPNITALPLTVLAAWLFLRGRRRPLAGMAGALAVMLSVSLLISPGWYLELLKPDKATGLSYTLNPSGGIQVERYTTTLLDWLAAYGVDGNPAYGIYAVVVFAGSAWAGWLAYRSRSFVEALALALAINFAMTPYALFYDYPSLAVTLFYLGAGLPCGDAAAWGRRLMHGLILLSLFVGDHIAYRYWIVVVILSYVILCGIAARAAGDAAGQKKNP